MISENQDFMECLFYVFKAELITVYVTHYRRAVGRVPNLLSREITLCNAQNTAVYLQQHSFKLLFGNLVLLLIYVLNEMLCYLET